MFKLTLNLHKANNYAFFCPVSKVHLTVSNPVGFASEVTPAILRAIKANNVIDADNVIDLETGKIAKKETSVDTKQVEDNAEVKTEHTTEEIAEENKSSRKSKKSAKVTE